MFSVVLTVSQKSICQPSDDFVPQKLKHAFIISIERVPKSQIVPHAARLRHNTVLFSQCFLPLDNFVTINPKFEDISAGVSDGINYRKSVDFTEIKWSMTTYINNVA